MPLAWEKWDLLCVRKTKDFILHMLQALFFDWFVAMDSPYQYLSHNAGCVEKHHEWPEKSENTCFVYFVCYRACCFHRVCFCVFCLITPIQLYIICPEKPSMAWEKHQLHVFIHIFGFSCAVGHIPWWHVFLCIFGDNAYPMICYLSKNPFMAQERKYWYFLFLSYYREYF